jgi:hypothetical protein
VGGRRGRDGWESANRFEPRPLERHKYPLSRWAMSNMDRITFENCQRDVRHSYPRQSQALCLRIGLSRFAVILSNVLLFIEKRWRLFLGLVDEASTLRACSSFTYYFIVMSSGRFLDLSIASYDVLSFCCLSSH